MTEYLSAGLANNIECVTGNFGPCLSNSAALSLSNFSSTRPAQSAQLKGVGLVVAYFALDLIKKLATSKAVKNAVRHFPCVLFVL